MVEGAEHRDVCFIFAEKILRLIRESGMNTVEASASLRCVEAALACANDISFSGPEASEESEYSA